MKGMDHAREVYLDKQPGDFPVVAIHLEGSSQGERSVRYTDR